MPPTRAVARSRSTSDDHRTTAKKHAVGDGWKPRRWKTVRAPAKSPPRLTMPTIATPAGDERSNGTQSTNFSSVTACRESAMRTMSNVASAFFRPPCTTISGAGRRKMQQFEFVHQFLGYDQFLLFS